MRKLSHSLFSGSIGNRLFLRVVVVLSAILIPLFYFHIYFDADRRQDEAYSRLNRLVLALEPTIERSLWRIDQDALQTALISIAQQPSVEYAAIEAKYLDQPIQIIEGKISGADADCTDKIDRDFSDREVNGQRIGSGVLTICHSSTPASAGDVIGAVRTFVPQIIAIVISAFLIVMIVRRMIVRPLISMARQLGAEGPMLPPVRDRWDRNDELDFLYHELERRTMQLHTENSIARAAFRATSDGIVILDEQENIVRSSDSVKDLFMPEIEYMVSGGLWSVVPRTILSKHREVHSVKTHHGMHIEVTASPLDTGGYALIIQDVTEKQQALESAFAADKLAALSKMAAGVAHDFNNVLSVITGTADLIKYKTQGSLQRDALRILNAAETGTAVVSKLNVFSKPGGSSTATVTCREILEELRELTYNSQNNVKFETACESSASLKIDRGQLKSALYNLMLNAFEASWQTAVVKLRAYDTVVDGVPFVAMEVRDSGVGIKPDIMTEIRKPFFTTKGNQSGSGLGLSMVESFAQEFCGKLDIESSPEQGTAVTLSFPAIVDNEIKNTKPRTKNLDNFSSLSGEKVLVIDDQELLGSVLVDQMKSLHIDVDYARGSNSKHLLVDNVVEFDLILCDIMLEGETGLDLYDDLLKRLGRSPPFIFISGNAPTELLTRIENIPNAVFLAKPFTLSEISQVVQTQLKAYSGSSA